MLRVINYLLINMLLVAALAAVVVGLGATLRKKEHFDRSKLRPFECGFSPKFNARLPFSIRFFLIALIFLIFDVELVLLFPAILRLRQLSSIKSLSLILTLLVILLLGLIHEWNQGSLD